MNRILGIIVISISSISGWIIQENFPDIENKESQIPQCKSDYVSLDMVFPENHRHNHIVNTTANSIGRLSTIELGSINNFNQYQKFAGAINGGILILNEELGTNMPALKDLKSLKPTLEEYNKISNIITKYTPVVDSYNNMVNAAKKVDTSDPNSISCFYASTAIFSAEVILMSVPLGLPLKNTESIMINYVMQLRNKCFSCIPTVISHSKWFAIETDAPQTFLDQMAYVERFLQLPTQYDTNLGRHTTTEILLKG